MTIPRVTIKKYREGAEGPIEGLLWEGPTGSVLSAYDPLGGILCSLGEHGNNHPWFCYPWWWQCDTCEKWDRAPTQRCAASDGLYHLKKEHGGTRLEFATTGYVVRNGVACQVTDE